MTTLENGATFKPLKEGTFRFACHPGVDCFTRCCADLKLVLTPYDILRMKKRIGLPSHEFLEQHTETTLEPRRRFPNVTLKMMGNEHRTCPFVTPKGCTIYEDRPGACRIYPIGRAALKPHGEQVARERFFMVQEKHCLGFQANKEWTIDAWMVSEGVDEYNTMNDQWLEIVTSSKSLGPERDVSRKIQMFFMASYNLDRFREFVFRSRFLEIFHVTPGQRDRLASDDLALMQFGFEWLKFSLFGEKTLRLKH